MKLSVRDIGEERYITLLGRSMVTLQSAANGRYYGQNPPASPLPSSSRFAKSPARLARYWTRSLNLTEEQSQHLADQVWSGPYGATLRSFFIVMAAHTLIPIMFAAMQAPWQLVVASLFFPALWGMIILAMLLSPRQHFKQISERNLTVEEVETLLPTARGRLERQYFGLVLDALRTEVPTVSAQSDIQTALRHLGDLIMRLPSDPVAVPDAETLRREAQALRLQAHQESDAFVEGSLQRQAEMLEQRATLTTQNGRGTRRIAMLRREARAQMDNLRAVLVGFQQTPAVDAVNVSHLSAALQRVAGEAKAVALAHNELENEELERLYGSPLPPVETLSVPAPNANRQPIAVPTPQANVQVVGQGGAPTGTNPPPLAKNPNGSTRPWWRNNGTAG
jgi:hypothetical protein